MSVNTLQIIMIILLYLLYLQTEQTRVTTYEEQTISQSAPYLCLCIVGTMVGRLRYALKKKNDIIWEFFPNVGPPPPPPLLGTPYPKKNFSVYFAF